MSMRDNPGSGYVMAAADVLLMLPEELWAQATALLEDNDWEVLHDFLEDESAAWNPPARRDVSLRRRRHQRRSRIGHDVRPLG